MEKIKQWFIDNICKEPLFWNALGLGLTTKVEELGIPHNHWGVQIAQLVLGATAASFVGAKFNRNTALTQATHDAAKSSESFAAAAALTVMPDANSPTGVLAKTVIDKAETVVAAAAETKKEVAGG